MVLSGRKIAKIVTIYPVESIRRVEATDLDSVALLPLEGRSRSMPKLSNSTHRLVFCVVTGLVIAQIACSASAQMLSRRAGRHDIDSYESPPEMVSKKEMSLIHEVLEPELILRVVPSRSKIIRTKRPIGRIAIGNPAIVDVNEFDTQEIEVIGKQLGETTMTLWFPLPDGTTSVLRYLVRVEVDAEEAMIRQLGLSELQDRINEMFPNSQITLTALRNKIVVRGQARDAKEARDILTVLGRNYQRQNGGNGNRNGGNSGNGFGMGNMNVGYTGGGNSGDFTRNNQFARGTNSGGAGSSGGAGNGYGNGNRIQLINLLRVAGIQQVMLKVRVAELTRQSAREISADLKGLVGDIFLGHVIDQMDDVTAILDADDVRLFLRAVTSHGYGKILAEPTLATISGKTASFIAGGEFAVPTTVGVDGVNAVSTAFHGFGTEVEFTPTVVDKDMIRLHVSTSFSSINGDTTVNGIPGLNRRAVDTNVDLREGQWLAIAGLIQDEQGGNRAAMPILGNIPVIGNLFSNQGATRVETELIVLVSPELVHPMEAEQVPLMLPGMEVTDPTDWDFFRRHMIEGYAGNDYRSTVWPEVRAQQHGAVGHGLRGRIRGRLNSQRDYVSGDCGFSR